MTRFTISKSEYQRTIVAVPDFRTLPIVIVTQGVELLSWTMRKPNISYASISDVTPDMAFKIANALMSAAELAKEWDSDTGKPYKEVLGDKS